MVFTDAELRAFRAREQRAKELRTGDDADEDKENVREQNGAVVEAVTHPRRQYSLELLTRPAAPAPAAAPVSQEAPPPPLQPAPTAYRSPIVEAKNERFAAYKKYSELKPTCKPVVAPPSPVASPTGAVSPAMVVNSIPDPAAPAEAAEPAPSFSPSLPPAPAPAPASVPSPSRTLSSSEVVRLNGEATPPPPPPALAPEELPPPPPPAGSPPPSPPSSPPRPQQLGRRKLPEEIECERLSRAFVSHAPVDNKLQNLLGEYRPGGPHGGGGTGRGEGCDWELLGGTLRSFAEGEIVKYFPQRFIDV